jgi:hypothetical protein
MAFASGMKEVPWSPRPCSERRSRMQRTRFSDAMEDDGKAMTDVQEDDGR